ncbi:abortive infection family protein [Aliarcobacter cryaerophilus]|uniref:abortive infection family protein n=1 Tax=Aliarcobacter cryaerophilus TaxID=28198 RepID=UPI0021B5B0EE|nr:abortive infection family protein [Aliarcobacter cryaerophilus]MCT7538746.1 abortive infection family protein [Aliarcobacter cryaerophilus]
MNNLISPKYKMALIDDTYNKIWELYGSYKKVEFYIEKWISYVSVDWSFEKQPTFEIEKDSKNNIDLLSTLNKIDTETLLKIAIDLEIETPDFIPAIPTFKNIIKNDYTNANDTFQKAFKEIEEQIGLANSTLEGILKEILKDDIFKKKTSEFSNKTLYELTNQILKELYLFPRDNMPKEVMAIGSSILNINKSIEQLRSNKSRLHGKLKEEIFIDEPLYAYFIVNSVTTIGLFLISFYKKFKFENEEIPF